MEVNATILIPDISGFTEFITTTELTHSAVAINMLIDAIVKAVGEEYEVSEIEGDAVLLIKRDPAPSKKEIMDTCLKIFNSFHFQRKWMQQHTVCPCKACVALNNLTLKFVAHHGPLAEIKVGRFVKHSGQEMIVAHRLLKNSIANNEYLLMSEKVMQRETDISEVNEMDWTSSSEEFASIGKVSYQFALLNEAKKKTPEPPALQNDYRRDNTAYYEISIGANYMDVYMAIMNIPGRDKWQPGLQKVEQDIPHVFVGNTHHCTFENFAVDVTPVRMNVSEEEIIYAESCRIQGTDHVLVHEYVFKNIDNQSCLFAGRFMNAGESSIPQQIKDDMLDCLEKMAKGLKAYCEK